MRPNPQAAGIGLRGADVREPSDQASQSISRVSVRGWEVTSPEDGELNFFFWRDIRGQFGTPPVSNSGRTQDLFPNATKGDIVRHTCWAEPLTFFFSGVKSCQNG